MNKNPNLLETLVGIFSIFTFVYRTLKLIQLNIKEYILCLEAFSISKLNQVMKIH